MQATGQNFFTKDIGSPEKAEEKVEIDPLEALLTSIPDAATYFNSPVKPKPKPKINLLKRRFERK